MLLCNLYGGPGTGKSTTASGVFHLLKIKQVKCELITEYAKDLCYEGRKLDNQIKILGEQWHRTWRLKDSVDVAITDSPLLLSIVYNEESRVKRSVGFDSLNPLVLELHNYFPTLDFFLKRAKAYNKYGRGHSEEEAIKLDDQIRDTLELYKIPHDLIPANDEAPRVIVDLIMEKLNELHGRTS